MRLTAHLKGSCVGIWVVHFFVPNDLSWMLADLLLLAAGGSWQQSIDSRTKKLQQQAATQQYLESQLTA